MGIQCVWPNNLADPPLLPGEISVWSVRLDCASPHLESLAAVLSSDETARANRFHFERDRSAFIATRGILRQLLGKYLNDRPSKVQFCYHPKGKPFLAPSARPAPIEFNVSHSHGLALLAFSLGSPVGIDVELIRSDVASEQLAERYFAPEEVAELRSLPFAHRPEGFFRGWTRKEAYIKALGDGLQIPLGSFRVSLGSEHLPTLDSQDSARWLLCSLVPAVGFVGAVVAEGRDWRITCWNWDMTEV
jgi:4'-phosphopantetheinyl transferase